MEPVNWMGYEGELPPYSAHGHAMKDLRKDVLEPLSGIRTDLDSFHKTEAYALMAAGYKMIEAKSGEFEMGGLGSPPPQKFDWDFLKLVPPMADKKNPAHEDLKWLLRVGASLGGKIWRLEPIRSLLKLVLVVALVLAAIAGIGWAMEFLFPGLLVRIGSLWPWAVVILAALAGVKMISNWLTLGHFFVRHALSSTLFSVVLLLLCLSPGYTCGCSTGVTSPSALRPRPPSFSEPAVPRPSPRETDESSAYPILSHISRPRIATLRLAARRSGRLPQRGAKKAAPPRWRAPHAQ